MQLRFMRFVVLSTCHILIPLTLAAVGFYVAALITHHLIASGVCAGLAGLAAFFSASRIALVAIGPRFVDRDFPPTWKFLGQHMLKLFLVLLIAPATVFVAYLVSMWFTPFCVIIAILAGLPGQFAASLVLAADADVWFWRIRRGRPIQSAKDILKRIRAMHNRRRNVGPIRTVGRHNGSGRFDGASYQTFRYDEKRQDGYHSSHAPASRRTGHARQ